jgi:hypothetical protein
MAGILLLVGSWLIISWLASFAPLPLLLFLVFLVAFLVVIADRA